MKRRKLCLLVTAAATFALASPAAAQMDHSKMPGMEMPAPAKKSAAKKPAAKKAAAKKAGPKKAAAKKPATEKPSAAKKPAPDPHAGHQMPAQPQAPADPHAGHDMSTMPTQQGQTMPPGHDMSQMPGMAAPGAEVAGTNLPAGNAPPPPVPTDYAADAFFPPQAMEMARHHLQKGHGGLGFFQVFTNIMEYQVRNGRNGFEWDSEAWYGGDINRLWLKSEAEGTFGEGFERNEFQALYSRAIDPYFNLQAGIRYDIKPDPSRVYAVAGVEGLAPSFFELEAFAFLSNKGELMARIEGYYDQRLTQRLILQPRAEVAFAAQDSREIGIGSGLSSAELGMRLRYDIRREFAPYLGIHFERTFGDTRRFRQAQGEAPSDVIFVVGLRTWF